MVSAINTQASATSTRYEEYFSGQNGKMQISRVEEVVQSSYTSSAVSILFGYWCHFFRQKATPYVVKSFVGLEDFWFWSLVRDTARMCFAPCTCEYVRCVIGSCQAMRSSRAYQHNVPAWSQSTELSTKTCRSKEEKDGRVTYWTDS